MRFAAFRLKGKFYLLGLGVVCLGVAGAKQCQALSTTPTLRSVVALRASETLSGAAPAARSISGGKYETLKARVLGNDLTVDWVEFRAVAAEAGMESYDWHPARRSVLMYLQGGNLTAALSGAQIVIDHNMANPEGHLLAMTVYQQMGQEQAADRERRIIDAIVKSIMASGDGRSAQHAWSTVSSGEEEFVVNMVLDADTESQALVQTGGRAYDCRTVRTDDGSERVLWFKSNAQEHATLAAEGVSVR